MTYWQTKYVRSKSFYLWNTDLEKQFSKLRFILSFCLSVSQFASVQQHQAPPVLFVFYLSVCFSVSWVLPTFVPTLCIWCHQSCKVLAPKGLCTPLPLTKIMNLCHRSLIQVFKPVLFALNFHPLFVCLLLYFVNFLHYRFCSKLQ